MKPKIIAVVGPTASGKTSLGIFLAKKLGGEIISADSRQVYKGLDIGTGKVTKKEMSGIPHHLLDVANPQKQFSVDDFVRLARPVLNGLIYQSKPIVPIVVGGTGFYVDALLGRVTLPNVPPNPKLRARLEKKNVGELFKMLQQEDPARAATIEPHHKRRLIRALEISYSPQRHTRSESRLAGQRRVCREELSLDVLWLGINLPEARLRKNIHSRLFARISEGMLAEARRLHARGLSYRRMRELGLEYTYLADVLQHKISRREFEERLERAIWHYAKRQLRWFRRNPDIRWVTSRAGAARLAKEFLSA